MEAEASLNVRDEYPLPHIIKDDLQRLRVDLGMLLPSTPSKVCHK
jgi:hypothetical protein